jgi:hypothetical protein
LIRAFSDIVRLDKEALRVLIRAFSHRVCLDNEELRVLIRAWILPVNLWVVL